MTAFLWAGGGGWAGAGAVPEDAAEGIPALPNRPANWPANCGPSPWLMASPIALDTLSPFIAKRTRTVEPLEPALIDAPIFARSLFMGLLKLARKILGILHAAGVHAQIHEHVPLQVQTQRQCAYGQR
jgi:hypothetical protein